MTVEWFWLTVVSDCGCLWVTPSYAGIRQQQRMRNICWRKSSVDWVVSAKRRWKSGGLICLNVTSSPATGCTNMPSRLLQKVFEYQRCQFALWALWFLNFFEVWDISFSNGHQLFAFSALTLLVGCQEEHLACTKWAMGCWCGCLSGARCWLFAYGPAHAIASQSPVISCLL